MCGRFQLNQDSELVSKYFSAQTQFDFQPRFNIAPRQDAAIIRNSSEGRIIAPMNWGLVPSWTPDLKKALRPINAKAETVATSGMFRGPFAKSRCLIPATGFYEWQQLSPKHKLPFLINLPDRPLYAMAGLYDNWRNSEGEWKQTFTIITTAPNDLVSNVHDRMPVILAREYEEVWLNPSATAADLQQLLTAYPEAQMQAIPISTLINSVANEGPEAASPATPPIS